MSRIDMGLFFEPPLGLWPIKNVIGGGFPTGGLDLPGGCRANTVNCNVGQKVDMRREVEADGMGPSSEGGRPYYGRGGSKDL